MNAVDPAAAATGPEAAEGGPVGRRIGGPVVVDLAATVIAGPPAAVA
ncbi:hypothetical protein [Enemella evansiae]|nr:hypothetical protein [Enemella evansiae]PFG66841.1 hypothetical protein B0O41_1642 [Propionibacteriaceae bacterium ES.041]TDO92709.1 hypothetical protein C8D81_0474 [Enemella evansiae]